MIPDSVYSVVDWAPKQPFVVTGLLGLVALVSFAFQKIFRRLWLHPLSSFPGPKVAAATTLWKAYVECILNKSFCHVLEELHAKHGEYLSHSIASRPSDNNAGNVIRIGPDEVRVVSPQLSVAN
jgi:hypothetical protein